MKTDDDPIEPDEVLLRLVFGNKLSTLTDNFVPRPGERGLSLFRRDCLASPADALANMKPANRPKFHGVCLSVSDLLRLGLRVERDPVVPDAAKGTVHIPGHVILPDINSEAVAADPDHWFAKRNQLADLAELRVLPAPLTVWPANLGPAASKA